MLSNHSNQVKSVYVFQVHYDTFIQQMWCLKTGKEHCKFPLYIYNSCSSNWTSNIVKMPLDSRQFLLDGPADKSHRAWQKNLVLTWPLTFTKCHSLEIMRTYNQITSKIRHNATRPPEFRVYGSQQYGLFSKCVTKYLGPGTNTLQTWRNRNSYDGDGGEMHFWFINVQVIQTVCKYISSRKDLDCLLTGDSK